jgi:hypothetical protein
LEAENPLGTEDPPPLVDTPSAASTANILAMADANRPNRALSVSSAGTASSTGAYSFIPRYTPKPEAAYISASAAADHISHRGQEGFDLLSPSASPTHEVALFGDNALALLNSFLDSLLYNFLAKARGTKLPELREGILEVLKTRLGRDALASADEELEGLVGDDDMDEHVTSYTNGNGDLIRRARSSSTAADWHLESAFKRMRLRVMVFIRLGDFDDDDEDKFLEDEDDTGPPPDLNFLSSPAAVYLASVLEYLAEQTLSLAGDAAYARARSRARRTINENSTVESFDAENVIVEEMDVEKIALNPTVGRLWRTFRKNHRSITSPASPTRAQSRRSSLTSPTRFADDVLMSSSHRDLRRNSSRDMIKEESETPQEEIPDWNPTETAIAANIPLPTNERDVDEIEVPGIAQVIYDDGEERWDDFEPVELPERRRSLSHLLPAFFGLDQVRDLEAGGDVIKPVGLGLSYDLTAPIIKPRAYSLTATTLPWDWIPLSIRKVDARWANMDELERAEFAAGVPLPEDEAETAIAALSADSEPLVEQEASKGLAQDSQVELEEAKAAKATRYYQVPGSFDETPSVAEETDPFEAPRVEEPAVAKSNKGYVAGAALLAAAAAGAMAAAVVGSSKGEDREASRTPNLAVQSKAVFSPDELDSARPSLDIRSHPAAIGVASSTDVAVHTKPNASAKKQVSFADDEKRPEEKKPLLASVYAPRKPSIAMEDTSRQVIGQAAEQSKIKTTIGAAGQSKDAEKTSEPKGVINKEPVPDKSLSVLVPMDSKAASPNHIFSQASAVLAQSMQAKDNDKQSSSEASPTSSAKPSPMVGPSSRGSPPSGQKSDGKSTGGGSSDRAISPLDHEASPIQAQAPTSTPSQEAQNLQTPAAASRKLSTRDGPPLPLTATATGNRPVNPYAMLYDDIEPGAIGVAKTSNIPIHSTTPTSSTSTDARPWTPSRGPGSRNVSPELGRNTPVATTNGERTRNVPSPLRIGKQERPERSESKTEQSQVTPERLSSSSPQVIKQVVSKSSSEYDLDRPINPERFQTWNRPKESPTIPRFFNQPLSTPTESQRPVSGAPSLHSPKESQGSQKSQRVRRVSEELKEQQFDALLDRKETVKYTLTPEEIRDVSLCCFHMHIPPSLASPARLATRLLTFTAIFTQVSGPRTQISHCDRHCQKGCATSPFSHCHPPLAASATCVTEAKTAIKDFGHQKEHFCPVCRPDRTENAQGWSAGT